VLTLVSAAAIGYLATRSPAPLTPEIVDNGAGPSAEAIATQLEDNFADLASILSVALGAADTETASSTTADASSDPADFDLPRFDFLATEMEGSL
jgi:hypothetical protein